MSDEYFNDDIDDDFSEMDDESLDSLYGENFEGTDSNKDNHKKTVNDTAEMGDEYFNKIQNDQPEFLGDNNLEGVDVAEDYMGAGGKEEGYMDEGGTEEDYMGEGDTEEGYMEEGYMEEGYMQEGYMQEGYMDAGGTEEGYIEESDAEEFSSHSQKNKKRQAIDFPIEINIQLGMLNFTNHSALSMDEGDILKLETNCPGEVSLIFQGREIGRGKLVDVDGFIGVQITHNWCRS